MTQCPMNDQFPMTQCARRSASYGGFIFRVISIFRGLNRGSRGHWSLVIRNYLVIGHCVIGHCVIGHCHSRFLLLTALILAGASTTPAQDAPTRRPPFVIQPNSGVAPITPRIAPANQDAFSALIGSAASIDMDGPVTARAEFDPPVIPPGGRAIYRI